MPSQSVIASSHSSLAALSPAGGLGGSPSSTAIRDVTPPPNATALRRQSVECGSSPFLSQQGLAAGSLSLDLDAPPSPLSSRAISIQDTSSPAASAGASFPDMDDSSVERDDPLSMWMNTSMMADTHADVAVGEAIETMVAPTASDVREISAALFDGQLVEVEAAQGPLSSTESWPDVKSHDIMGDNHGGMLGLVSMMDIFPADSATSLLDDWQEQVFSYGAPSEALPLLPVVSPSVLTPPSSDLLPPSALPEAQDPTCDKNETEREQEQPKVETAVALVLVAKPEKRRGRPPKKAKQAPEPAPTAHAVECVRAPSSARAQSPEYTVKSEIDTISDAMDEDDEARMIARGSSEDHSDGSFCKANGISLSTFKPQKPMDSSLAAEYAQLKNPALSSRDRRALRNKLSARSFRERRKEYIETLEAELKRRDVETEDLRNQLEKVKKERESLETTVQELVARLASLGVTTGLPSVPLHSVNRPTTKAEYQDSVRSDSKPTLLGASSVDWSKGSTELAPGPENAVAGPPAAPLAPLLVGAAKDVSSGRSTRRGAAAGRSRPIQVRSVTLPPIGFPLGGSDALAETGGGSGAAMGSSQFSGRSPNLAVKQLMAWIGDSVSNGGEPKTKSVTSSVVQPCSRHSERRLRTDQTNDTTPAKPAPKPLDGLEERKKSTASPGGMSAKNSRKKSAAGRSGRNGVEGMEMVLSRLVRLNEAAAMASLDQRRMSGRQVVLRVGEELAAWVARELAVAAISDCEQEDSVRRRNGGLGRWELGLLARVLVIVLVLVGRGSAASFESEFAGRRVDGGVNNDGGRNFETGHRANSGGTAVAAVAAAAVVLAGGGGAGGLPGGDAQQLRTASSLQH